MCDGTWYNPTICYQWNGFSFEHLFRTGCKYRYYIRCTIDTYGDICATDSDYASSGGIRLLPNIILNFINNWIQFFESTCTGITALYKYKMRALFNKIPSTLPGKHPDDYKKSISIKLIRSRYLVS